MDEHKRSKKHKKCEKEFLKKHPEITNLKSFEEFIASYDKKFARKKHGMNIYQCYSIASSEKLYNAKKFFLVK